MINIEECAKEVLTWFENSAEKDKVLFKQTDISQVISYHNTLGRSIRNHFSLWENEWEPEIVDGIDISEDHPDAVSMKIIKRVHEMVLGS